MSKETVMQDEQLREMARKSDGKDLTTLLVEYETLKTEYAALRAQAEEGE